MSEDILKVLSNRESEPGIILFHKTTQPRLVLSNGEEDNVVVPHDLLPESCQGYGGMLDAVGVVRHLVKAIRELEAENADLRRELKAALERC